MGARAAGARFAHESQPWTGSSFSKVGGISPESKSRVKLYQEYYANVIIIIKDNSNVAARSAIARTRALIPGFGHVRGLTPFLVFLCLTALPVGVPAQVTGGTTPGPAPGNNQVSHSSLGTCLPAGIKLSDVVDATSAGVANGQPVGLHKVTVEQKLSELGSTCNKDNKLVDSNGKQIVFYHLTGCWGNPPAGAQEILRRQRQELDKLKEQYTVIEMTCNPSGAPIP